MRERFFTTNFDVRGTLTANHVFIDEFDFAVTYLGSKAYASNDSDATLAVSGGATVSAAAIGDSSDPAFIEPTNPDYVAADTAITFTLDYDGSAGTAAQNVRIINHYLVNEA